MHYGVADGTILAVSTDALAHCTVHILFYQASGAPVSVKPLAHTHHTHTYTAPLRPRRRPAGPATSIGISDHFGRAWAPLSRDYTNQSDVTVFDSSVGQLVRLDLALAGQAVGCRAGR